MRPSQTLSITLNADMADMVRAKVASGEYASESEVIEDGLMSLMPEDAAIEKWLIEEVVPTFDEMKAHPERLLSIEEVDRRLDERMAQLLEAEKRR